MSGPKVGPLVRRTVCLRVCVCVCGFRDLIGHRALRFVFVCVRARAWCVCVCVCVCACGCRIFIRHRELEFEMEVVELELVHHLLESSRGSCVFFNLAFGYMLPSMGSPNFANDLIHGASAFAAA